MWIEARVRASEILLSFERMIYQSLRRFAWAETGDSLDVITQGVGTGKAGGPMSWRMA